MLITDAFCKCCILIIYWSRHDAAAHPEVIFTGNFNLAALLVVEEAQISKRAKTSV